MCWGDDDDGQIDAPGGTFSAVSAGGTRASSHVCGLRTSGAIECWGDNNDGQTDAPGGTFNAVSAGWYHTCGLRTDGAIDCWGDNFDGQTDAPDGTFSAVSAGSYNTCGLRTSGAIVCWGGNNPGQPGALASAVSVGFAHACGLRASGAIKCWAYNVDGQADAPVGSFDAVSAGWRHTCGLRTSGAIECWGYTFDGQTQPPAGRLIAISSGDHHACALIEDGTAVCWMIFNGAADVPAWLRDVGGDVAEAINAERGRIVVRRLADGRTEFGWLPAGAVEPILPGGRYFPASVAVGRWLRTKSIEIDGVEIGRINARLLMDGRIELAFTPTANDRILPPLRYLPTDAQTGRWLRSTQIDLSE